jgi:hypothetical protein
MVQLNAVISHNIPVNSYDIELSIIKHFKNSSELFCVHLLKIKPIPLFNILTIDIEYLGENNYEFPNTFNESILNNINRKLSLDPDVLLTTNELNYFSSTLNRLGVNENIQKKFAISFLNYYTLT